MNNPGKIKSIEVGFIPEDWEVKKLEDVKKEDKGSIISGPFGSNIGSRFFTKTGVPVIRGNNLTTDFRKFIDDGFVFISKEKAYELNTWADEDDLIFTAAGTLGQVGIIPKKRKFERYIISNKQLRARLDKKQVLPIFAFYWFQSKKMMEYIKMRSTGSTIPLINLSVLRSLPLPCPKLEEQEAIAKVLSDFDSKIELNQQMNKTLDEIGKSIFKHWFIKFEFPDIEGKPYKSNGGKLIYNEELGESIPENWKVVKFSEIIRITMGLSPKGESYNDAGKGLPLINGAADFSNGHIKPKKFTTQPTRVCEKDDLLFCIRGTIGNLTYADRNYCLGRGVAAIANISEIHNEYVFFILNNKLNSMISKATGSVIIGLSKPDILDLKILLPPENIMKKFHVLLENLFLKKELNKAESTNLLQIRDSLLPKLMFGKIRVSTGVS